MKIAIQLLSGGIVNRGAEHSMLMLASDLRNLGHEVVVFQGGPGENQIKLPFLPTSHKPKNIFGKVLERLYLDKRSLLSLIFSLKTVSHLASFDVIIPTDGYWSVLIAKLFKKRGAKIVCVGLAGIGWTDRDTLRLNPDGFVALSSLAKTWASEINPKCNVVVIPLQVDTKKFHQALPKESNLKKPIILTVAALTKYKQVDKVIEAVAKIPDTSLLIVGQGEEKENLQKLCDQLLPGRSQIRTATFDELPGIYASADCFVLQSKSQEAFGQVLVEAMAAGLPIVTTDDPIRREIVGEQGFYADTSEGQVIKLIKAAISKGKQTYNLDGFDRHAVARKYEEFIKVQLLK